MGIINKEKQAKALHWAKIPRQNEENNIHNSTAGTEGLGLVSGKELLRKMELCDLWIINKKKLQEKTLNWSGCLPIMRISKRSWKKSTTEGYAGYGGWLTGPTSKKKG